MFFHLFTAFYGTDFASEDESWDWNEDEDEDEDGDWDEDEEYWGMLRKGVWLLKDCWC